MNRFFVLQLADGREWTFHASEDRFFQGDGTEIEYIDALALVLAGKPVGFAGTVVSSSTHEWEEQDEDESRTVVFPPFSAVSSVPAADMGEAYRRVHDRHLTTAGPRWAGR